MIARFDTNKAGAFMNLYRVIGKSGVVKDIDGDADLLVDRARVLRSLAYQHETSKGTFVTIDDMCREAQEYINFLTTKYYANNHH